MIYDPSLVIIGLIYDSTNPDKPVPLSGWHINSAVEHTELAAYKVTPQNPYNVIAGVDTVYYKFDDETSGIAALAAVGLADETLSE